MSKIPTIYDVSRQAGVSAATVSRVMNDPGKVNEETRQQVENAIKELNYKPLVEARLRSLKDTMRICAVAPHFTANSFVQRLRGISLALADTNYDLQVYSVTSMDQLDRFVDTVNLRGIDGVICISLRMSEEKIQKIQESGAKVVLIEESSALADCIVIDDYDGGRKAARHLLDKGYRNFGIVIEPAEWDFCVYTIPPRMNGFKDELKTAGIEVPDNHVYNMHLDLRNVYEKFLKIFQKKDFPNAFFCTADIMAFGIMRAAKEMGLRVPEDVAVVGFDDIDYADYLGLTTIRQHLDESGELAAKMIINRLKNPEHSVQEVKLSLDLIEREST